ncbi:MAG: large-conductance mechanosensitive channel protein MscL [Chloroherpetonaceae bacterium]
MSFIQEFKQFAVRGNVIDLAIGVVIGGAFGKIVNSLVADIITPPLGLLIGGVDFSNLVINLNSPIGDLKPVTINYGKFLQASFDFIIIAFALFLIIRTVNRLQKKEKEKPAPPPEIPADVKLLTEIRDLLKK